MTETEFQRELFRRLEGYVAAVEQTNMPDHSRATYNDHAKMFVRWVLGNYTPGARRGVQGSNNIDEIRLLVP